jgi:6-pyruvoyltetrahydropterin/6-carboxytetrahydropterin synthase
MGILGVTKAVEFSSAHFLPNYEGNCKNLHGHTWKLEVTVCMFEDTFEDKRTKQGMILDFKKLYSILDNHIIKLLDHKLINDVIENPTAENLVLWAKSALIDALIEEFEDVWLQRIKLWESPTSYVEWRSRNV